MKQHLLQVNVTVGLVETTNGVGQEDLSLSITKEAMGDWIIESRNQYTNASTSDAAVDGYITLEARDGDASEVDLALRMVLSILQVVQQLNLDDLVF